MTPKRPRIVLIGGGTGTSVLLHGFAKHPVQLSAIVSMADNGGSTGMLRRELAVSPPGDVRQCLAALADVNKEAARILLPILNHRFPNGRLKGHAFGNLLLAALEEVHADFGAAVQDVSTLLGVRGAVIPVTLDKITLVARTKKREIRGQRAIYWANLKRVREISLEPVPRLNPKAKQALKNANIIVIGPGDFYSSVIPCLVMPDIKKAIAESHAKKIYICNLATKPRQTEGWSVADFAERIENYLESHLDGVFYNTMPFPRRILQRSKENGALPVLAPVGLPIYKFRGAPLLKTQPLKHVKGDPLLRNVVIHDAEALAPLLINFL